MAYQSISGVRILVPLDGSELAEQSLPAAARLAQTLRSTLVLARVTHRAAPTNTPPTKRVPLEVYQQLADDEARAAEEYLACVAGRIRKQGVMVETIARRGEAASTLIDLLSALQIGLVVMTTPARTGLARFTLGSVTDRLVRASHVPVLLLRSLTADDACDRLERALVPLDGSELAEAALEPVRALAGPVIHTVMLLRVIAQDDIPRRRRELWQEMDTADRYLDDVQARLAEQVKQRATIQTQVLGGDPADQIIRCAGKECDLVIMATHGIGGTQRWVFGSVADRVLHNAQTPLLLVCPQGSTLPDAGYQRRRTASRPRAATSPSRC